MLTKLIIENFKKIIKAEIDLTSAVTFVGPNNSGKTTALQAISLWYIGMQRLYERSKTTKAVIRTGATINRKELLSMPTPSALQLWNGLKTRKGLKKDDGKLGTENIRIRITVKGFTDNNRWELGLEFDYANPESIYCRTINPTNEETKTAIDNAIKERVGFLPPMSGLSSDEDKLELGSIYGRIGEGRTADVLRNLCWNVFQKDRKAWEELIKIMEHYFKVELDDPIYDVHTGKIYLTYRDDTKKNMALSNSGRGFQQILLLFSYIFGNENTILLLDEPDAHLEAIRQREVYNKLSEIVKNKKSQLIIATHSETVLNEAAEKDTIVGFIGTPHIANKAQLMKSLKSIGFDQYMLAEQKKWVLYLEGSTDLSMLQAYAKRLEHPVLPHLESAFVKTVDTDKLNLAEDHYFGLKEAVPDLLGCVLFDNLNKKPSVKKGLEMMMWSKREIENYLPLPEVIKRFIEREYSDDLFTHKYGTIMDKIVDDYIPPIAQKDKNDDWWKTTKMSDDFLDKIFRRFYGSISSPILMDKSSYYKLALLAKPDELDKEITDKLNIIFETAKKAEETVMSTDN